LEVIKLKGEFKELFKIRVFFINLVILLTLWIVSSFNWYMITFQVKYIGGDIFLNTYLATGGDLIAIAMSGVMKEILGIKQSFVIMFGISLLGSLIYIVVETKNSTIIAIIVLIAKFGIGGTFNICFLANS
jgi:Na+/melibiose symporter-like transporter